LGASEVAASRGRFQNPKVEVTTVNERLNAVATAHLKTFTPKARRVDELRVLGKSFDEAFAIADREFTPDGNFRADEKRRQETLFKPPQLGTSTTKVPTVDDQLYAKAVSVATQVGKVNYLVLQRQLIISEAQATALLTRLQENNVIGSIINGSYWCIVSRNAQSQTVAKQPRPAGQIARAKQLNGSGFVRPKAKSDEKSNLEKIKISLDIERQVRTSAMEAICKKAKLDRALVNEVLLEMLCDAAALFAVKAVKAFGWPKPNNGQHFSYVEIRKAGRKLIPKMKPNHIAALLLACLVQEDLDVYRVRQPCEKIEAMARLYKVNIGKIRKDVVAAVKKKGSR
jgi:hypothetical protein